MEIGTDKGGQVGTRGKRKRSVPASADVAVKKENERVIVAEVTDG